MGLRFRGTPHGVMFHHFHDDTTHPRGQGSISASELDALIRALGRERILSAHEWSARAASGTLGEGALCLTFDDNLRCQFDVALPVLEAHGLTAFFFVYTAVLQGELVWVEVYRHFRTTHFPDVDTFYAAFATAVDASPHAAACAESLRGYDPARYHVDSPYYTAGDRRFRYLRDEALGPARFREVMDGMLAARGVDAHALASSVWMDAACLRQLHAGGHVIGLHSHTHPTRLERLGRAGQEAEYAGNQQVLRDLIGVNPVSMSHPCNSYDETTLEVLRGLGINLGFRANMAQPRYTALEHPREDHANLMAELRA